MLSNITKAIAERNTESLTVLFVLDGRQKEKTMSHYVDADGHIMEKTADLISYLEEPWRSNETVAERRLLPSLDEFHTPRFRKKGYI